ncbi:MAG: hypothetical protein PHU85_17475 [Phycisphaerae bacterium]|nr:hypothetical protein [Phycisphaerae bacterium]
MADPDKQDEPGFEGRCMFCGAEVAADQSVCPECGRDTDEGPVYRPRRPIWARALVWLVLLMLAAWLVTLLVRWIKGG